MNMTAPDVVENIQRRYYEAGSDILVTNTFGANARALKGTGYTVEEIVKTAVAITKRAGMGKTLTALDIGPIGEFISPFGTLSFDESYELYRAQVVAAEAAGADLVAIETMSDLLEVKAVMLAIKENTRLPIFAMMTFDKSGRTFTGCKPESFAITAEGLGASAIGINCSLSPREIFPIAEKLARSTSLPLIVKANAGLPNSVTGGYDIDAVEFADQMERFAQLGVKIIGGCCGTTPEYIAELCKRYGGLKPAEIQKDMAIRVCTPLQIEDIESFEFKAPADKDVLSPDDIIEDALEQSDSGKKILTVRLLDGISSENAANVIRSIQSQSDRPLGIVSNNFEALSSALRALTGVAAVLCTSCTAQELNDVAKKYGAAVIKKP